MLPDPLTTSPPILANPNGNCSGPAISFQVKDPDAGAGRWYDSWISVSVGYRTLISGLSKVPACKPDDLVRILSRCSFSFIGHSDRFRFLSSYCRNELRILSITIINEIFSCWKQEVYVVIARYPTRSLAIYINMDRNRQPTPNVAPKGTDVGGCKELFTCF